MPDIKKLQAATAGSKEDSAELAVVYNARTTALRAYNERPGKATSEDLKSARELYQQTIDRLQQKYFPEKSGDVGDGIQQMYKNRAAAYRFIQEQGIPIAERTFYGHCDKYGLRQPDKTLRLSDLIAYINKVHKTVPSGPDLTIQDRAAKREDAETRKAVAEADRSEIKRDDERRELDKKWIKREEADLEVCTWTALLRDSIAHRLNQNIPTLIHGVGGYLNRVADAQAIIDQAITDACNDISNSDEVEVDIEEIDEAG